MFLAAISIAWAAFFSAIANCFPIPIDAHQMMMFPYPPVFGPTALAPAANHMPAPMFAPSLTDYNSMNGGKSSKQAAFFVPPFEAVPQFEASRRSLPTFLKSLGSKKANKQAPSGDKEGADSDEQKALADLPVSFMEPDGPSTITERLGETFGVLGEGVKNHFRSIHENFADTVDDLKETWLAARKRA